MGYGFGYVLLGVSTVRECRTSSNLLLEASVRESSVRWAVVRPFSLGGCPLVSLGSEPAFNGWEWA